MALITYEAAARILAAHSMECRPSAEAGRIEVLAQFVDADDNASSEWESITLSIPAIRDWLEY